MHAYISETNTYVYKIYQFL